MKKTILTIIKHMFIQMSMICFGILSINSILIAITHNYGGDAKIDYLFPLSIFICSVLCGITIIIFYIQKIPFIAQCIIHFCLLVGIVTGISFWFHWISNPIDLFIVYGVLVIVYLVIWVITYRESRISANRINKALENNHDED